MGQKLFYVYVLIYNLHLLTKYNKPKTRAKIRQKIFFTTYDSRIDPKIFLKHMVFYWNGKILKSEMSCNKTSTSFGLSYIWIMLSYKKILIKF